MAACLETILTLNGKTATFLDLTSGPHGASLARALRGSKKLKSVLLYPKGTVRGLSESDFVWNGGNIYPIEIDGETMTLLQTDTAINPGNSGGGLFDDSGNLIGIVNAKSSGSDIEGLGFAIPANTVKTVISDLMNYGYVKGRVGLGISVVYVGNYQTMWMYGVSEPGLYISKVDSGSDAEKAGLKSGDIIVSLNNAEIESDADLSAALKKCSVGDTINMVIRRNGQNYSVDITLSEYKG